MRSLKRVALYSLVSSVCACSNGAHGEGGDDAGSGNETSYGGSWASGGVRTGGGGGAVTSGGGTSGGTRSGGAGGTVSAGGTISMTGGSASGGLSTGGASGGGAGASCEPREMATWQPPPFVPARESANACTDREIQEYYSECFWAFGDAKNCAPFEAGGPSAACGACLRPDALDATAWGPLIAVAPEAYVFEPNVSGCVELLGEAACAEKIQAAEACARAACIDACAPEDQFDAQAYGPCVIAARGSVCKSYQDQTLCIGAAATADACSGSGFEALFLALAKVSCGSG